jgi:signal transduction histidine kinase/ActR/RegA family two-component response regulator
MKHIINNASEKNLITLLEMNQLKQKNEHSQETEQLRSTIKELLQQLEAQFDLIKDKKILEQLVNKLQNANQSLVIASITAQSLQESAEQAQSKQEQFLAMLAHELRNPLAPIMMATELIDKLKHSHEQLPKLHGILSRQVRQLSHLVDDLLDASRISSGHISLRKEHCSLKAILDNAIEISSPSLNQRHQHLHTDLSTIPLFVDGDFLRLSQVFSNLLINASKFSPEYEAILISVKTHHERILVTVKDNGIGINKEMQHTIFELFSQGYQAVDRAQGGLGIGLALVRSIVDMHDGSVTVNSDGLGLGSEFIVNLPIAEDVAHFPQQRLRYAINPLNTINNVKPLHILIIEDNSDTLTVLSDTLINEGHHVSSALTGEAGLQLIEENAASPFQLIFCDLGLPDQDGFEIAKRIRAIGDISDISGTSAYTIRPCLIAYTGYNQVADQERAKAAGFDHYLVKPVATETLLNLISTWVAP